MISTELMKEAVALLESTQCMAVTSIDEYGFPRTRALMKAHSEGLKYIWFTTSNQSTKVAHFRSNPRASIYIGDYENYKGIMLTGTMEVLEDCESKQLAWQEGFEKFYPEGIETPWYCVLKLTALHGQYYHGRPYDIESIQD